MVYVTFLLPPSFLFLFECNDTEKIFQFACGFAVDLHAGMRLREGLSVRYSECPKVRKSLKITLCDVPMCNKQITVMKKFFRMVTALSLVAGVLAFTGCTDYEDDINGLSERIDALETGKIADVEKQVSSLQSAITTAQNAIDALEALNLEELKTTVESLQSTVEAIDLSKYATLEYVDATFATVEAIADLNADLGALENKVTALEGKYDSDLKISEILVKIQDAQDDASSALGEIKSLKEALGVYATAGKLEEALGDKLDVADFDAKFKEALKAALENNGEVTGEIAEAIENAVNEFNAYFAGRITSVSLIPELYVDGIPAIEIKSLSYQPLAVTSTDKEESYKDNGKISTTAASASTVRYHVSPDGITNDDFKTPSYVIESAKVINTRAAVNEDLLTVTEAKMVNGELQVTVKKNTGISLDPDKADEIYTASLCVPIAEKNLVEGEESAYVYSEYSRLYETTVIPEIAALIDMNEDVDEYSCEDSETEGLGHHHFSATYDAAQNENPSNAQVYNKPLDLLAMVTGCYTTETTKDNNIVYKANELDKAALRASGLAFRFAVPTLPYIVGTTGANQQEFAKVEGNYLIATLPDGVVNNAAAVDKTPIVRVTLEDTVANKTVDVRYFKVEWTDVKTDPVSITIDPFEYVLSCEDFQEEFTWSEMITKVLAHVGEDGISHNEFFAMFDTNFEVTTTDFAVPVIPAAPNRTVAKDEVTGEFDTAVDESAAILTWKLTTAQIGNVIEDLLAGDKVTYSVDVKFPGKNKYIGALTIKFSVNVVLPELPSIHGFTEMNWDDFGKLARIYPIQRTSSQATEKVKYAYDLNTLFNTNADGLFVDNILTDDEDLENAWKCRKWDVQYSATQKYAVGYAPQFATGDLFAGDNDGTGYHLYKGLNDAAHIWWTKPNEDAPENTPYNWYVEDVAKIELRLPYTDGGDNSAAIGLLNENRLVSEAVADYKAGELKTVAIDIWSRINAYNVYKVKTINVWFVNPLTIDAEVKGEFTDAIYGGSKVSIADAFDSVKDFLGNTVNVYTGGSGSAEDLRVYYDVQTPAWKVDEALISINKNTNDIDNDLDPNNAADKALMSKLQDRYTQASVRLEGDDLVFYNEGGAAVTEVMYIWVPVSVEHKWGVWEYFVPIKVNPNPNTSK